MGKKEHIATMIESVFGKEPEVSLEIGLPTGDFWRGEYITVDLEHTDANPYISGKIDLIGLVNNVSDHAYLVTSDKFGDLKLKLQKYEKILVGHNISGDLLWLTKYGFKFNPNIKIYDTMIREKMFPDAPERGFSLKYLAKKYFKVKAWEAEVHGNWHKGEIPSLESLAKYCAQDCIATKSLFEKQQSDERNSGAFFTAMDYIMPMVNLMDNGIYVNPKVLSDLNSSTMYKILQTKQAIQKITGKLVVMEDEEEDEVGKI